jgi:ATP-binding cassette subfamily B protein
MKKRSRSVNWQTLRLFWQFTRPHPFLFWYGTIGAICGVLVSDIFPPLIVSKAFNHIQSQVQAGQDVTFATMRPYLILYIATTLASVVVWRTQAFAVWKYQIRVEQKIYEYLFNHLQRMGSKFHADRFGGSLVSQVNKFASAYDKVLSDFTWSILTGATALVASLLILAATNLAYTAVLAAIATCYFAVMFRQMKKQAPYNRALAASESDRTAKLADNITNVGTVRAFAGENTEEALFHKQTTTTRDTYFRLMSKQMKNELASHSGISVMSIAAFSAGIIAVTMFDAPVGTLYLMVSYTLALTGRLWQSMFVMRNMNRAFGDAADMTGILQLGPEIADPAQPEEISTHRGDIQFQGVTFRYPEDKRRPLFDNLDLHIKPGEKIGLVGHSGGGKTTITKLLLRFMDIQKGTIRIDGHDITAITQADLRSLITYVPQEPLLFHRTLRENIRYGQPDASDKQVAATAKMAHAHDFIADLSEGYDTLVGERGVKLSGGQRQRVAIARAMLKNAPILVLDEATSALDSDSEALIQDALWKLMEGRTAIVIAHRLSTIQKMDRIIVLDQGKIVEQGTHKELIRQGSVYATLWSHQSGGFIED